MKMREPIKRCNPIVNKLMIVNINGIPIKKLLVENDNVNPKYVWENKNLRMPETNKERIRAPQSKTKENGKEEIIKKVLKFIR